ncbi:unnamed protein product [Spirodela intermedia]|uniref:Uncharacterized protein n=1 Tax=Spirodela intermedia TaxID=51605 RepID=A0A7I8J7H6_SPIIN|nr:unnamed protein product [Spirodela intermedia]CAA6666029.1 unnamed protein product [Spirodela intermedia]
MSTSGRMVSTLINCLQHWEPPRLISTHQGAFL